MGQPNPPGDIPLYDGLGSEWNDILSAVPEDKRAEIGPRLKERISGYEPLKQWEDLQKSGITADQASTALDIYTMMEKDPKRVYDAIATHLGISPQEVQELDEATDEEIDDNPRLTAMQKQVELLSQIMLSEKNQSAAAEQAAKQDKLLEDEITSVKTKFKDDTVPEDELLMRMLHKGMTAEQAYQEYKTREAEIRKRRESPWVIGGGGAIPNKQINPTELSSQDTRKLVAQMMAHGNNERQS